MLTWQSDPRVNRKTCLLFGHTLHSWLFALGICLERTVWAPKMTPCCASQWMERLPTSPWTLGYVKQSTLVWAVLSSLLSSTQGCPRCHGLTCQGNALCVKTESILNLKMLAMFMPQMQYIWEKTQYFSAAQWYKKKWIKKDCRRESELTHKIF